MLQSRLLLRHFRVCLNGPLRSRAYSSLGLIRPEDAPPVPVEAPVDVSTFALPITEDRDSGNAISGMRRVKPRTPGLRHLIRPINDHLWKGRPHLPLTFPKKGHGKGGRNNSGRITVRHRGGGHKRRIRTVDFKRKDPGKQTVLRIEHDPGRNAHIALLENHRTHVKSYIVAADGMRAGDIVESYMAGIPRDLLDSMGGVVDPGVMAAQIARRGNCAPLHMMPVGTVVFCVGSAPLRGAKFCRAAGTHATVISHADPSSKEMENYCTVKLASGEVRRVHQNACATVGVASNINFMHQSLGKAGRKRWLGIRPTVRGLAMNAADHPHGGGRGKSKGNVNPVSPWNMPSKGGYKTRKVRRKNRWVVEPRYRNQGRRRRNQ